MNQRTKNGFGMVSNTVLRDPELSLGEKALYSYLCTYADGIDNELFVSVNKMAAECNIGVSTVKRYLSSLEKKSVILRIRNTYKSITITKILK
jgi:DNA-binding MarR family transcriptional regulator